MTIAAARALRNEDVCFVGIGMPSAASNLARLTHAPGITLIYESGTIATKPDVLPLSIGDGELCDDRADHGVGAGDVPLLAAGRPHDRRLPRRRADRPLRQSQHHGGRRLRQAEGAAAGRRRRAGDRVGLRRDLHHHGAVEAQLRRQARLHHLDGPRRGRRPPRAARPQDQGPDQARHRPLHLRAGPADEGNDGDVDPSRRHARADRRQHRLAGALCGECRRRPSRRPPTS